MSNNIKSLIGLLVFLAYPFLMQFLQLDLLIFEAAMWLLLLLIILWIYFVEKKTLASIGLNEFILEIPDTDHCV